MSQPRIRDAFCSYCGTQYPAPLHYPRTCASCSVTIWANPIPVSVVLVPVVDGAQTGLLVVRRAIEPQQGKLAIVGGFLEEHESWQEGGTREIREETGATVDPTTLEILWFASSSPKPNRVLLFSIAAPLPSQLAPGLPRGQGDVGARAGVRPGRPRRGVRLPTPRRGGPPVFRTAPDQRTTRVPPHLSYRLT